MLGHQRHKQDPWIGWIRLTQSGRSADDMHQHLKQTMRAKRKLHIYMAVMQVQMLMQVNGLKFETSSPNKLQSASSHSSPARADQLQHQGVGCHLGIVLPSNLIFRADSFAISLRGLFSSPAGR